jgi:prepilin-type processing-associated H-X9-DG protein
MAIAAQAYTSTFSGSYPPCLDTVYSPEFEFTAFTRKIEYCWDFSRVSDGSSAPARIVPGLIWQGRMLPQIQQCPSFVGPAMWADDRYTGYNYNSSYVGAFLKKKRKVTTTTGATAFSWEIAVKPAKQDQIRRAGQCAVFGDGEYAGGANKFMRSPWGEEKGARDYWVSTERGAGTQGYRHLKRTNVAFADGHGESRIQRFAQTYEFQQGNIPDNVGFLSADNSMYSLDPESDRRASSQMTP